MSDWFVFNTWLQGTLKEQIHLELFSSFDAQHKAIQENQVDLIYCNPYEASRLIREKGFIPLARPKNESDEAIIAVKKESPLKAVEDLKPGIKISTTDDPDVHMIAMIMIEPADLNKSNTTISIKDSYTSIAQDLLSGNADLGFFLKNTYGELSEYIKNSLRILVTSNIYLVHHALLVGPKMAHKKDAILSVLLAMPSNPESKSIVEGLGFSAWEQVSQEDIEFMIDLMDTLIVK
jgi:phosphonate transport system substrate-binding protein